MSQLIQIGRWLDQFWKFSELRVKEMKQCVRLTSDLVQASSKIHEL